MLLVCLALLPALLFLMLSMLQGSRSSVLCGSATVMEQMPWCMFHQQDDNRALLTYHSLFQVCR